MLGICEEKRIPSQSRDLAHWRIAGEAGYPQLPIPGDYAEYRDHMAPVIKKVNGRFTSVKMVGLTISPSYLSESESLAAVMLGS